MSLPLDDGANVPRVTRDATLGIVSGEGASLRSTPLCATPAEPRPFLSSCQGTGGRTSLGWIRAVDSNHALLLQRQASSLMDDPG